MRGDFLPRPACGERSDCEAIRVRGYRSHNWHQWSRIAPLTPTLSPQERGEGEESYPNLNSSYPFAATSSHLARYAGALPL
jgi:hypothetical protein